MPKAQAAKRRVHDFDRARQQRRRRTDVLKAFGQEYPVPASPPVGFVVFADQLNKERGADYQPDLDDLIELMTLALGKETFAELMAGNELEIDDLELLLEMIAEIWADEEDPEGEAPAPAEGAGSDTSDSTGG